MFWLRLMHSFGFWKASPRHYLRDWVSCPLATMWKSISLHVSTPCLVGNCYPWGILSDSASTYCTYFYLFFFFNFSIVQYSRFIVQYSVTVGRNLVWPETNLTPTMTIFSSILVTKRQWQSSEETRPVWRRQIGVMSQMRSTDHMEMIFDNRSANKKRPDCDSQKVQHQAAVTQWVINTSTVGLSCHPLQLR